MKWKCWTISKGGELRWLGGRAMASDWRSQSFHKLSEVPFLRTLSLDILPVDHGYMFRYGSLCLRPLDNGRSLWSHGWTTGEANICWGKMNIFQGRRFERAQGWEPDLCAFQPLASRRPNPHAKVFNCQDLYCKLLPVKERGLSSWWRRRERSTPGLIRNLAAGFFQIWIKCCLHKTATLQTVGVRSILSDGASCSLPSSPHLAVPSPCRESQPC